jgi:hypothetical protein
MQKEAPPPPPGAVRLRTIRFLTEGQGGGAVRAGQLASRSAARGQGAAVSHEFSWLGEAARGANLPQSGARPPTQPRAFFSPFTLPLFVSFSFPFCRARMSAAYA